MAQTAVVKCEAIEPKPTKDGRTRWVLHTNIGNYGIAPWEAGLANIALAAVGKTAEITFDVTDKGSNLLSLVVGADTFAPEPVQAAPVAATAPSAPMSPVAPQTSGRYTPEEQQRLDVIGLRKTRCALWAAFIQSPLAASLDRNELGTVGALVVYAAENDIFTRVGAYNDTDAIPF